MLSNDSKSLISVARFRSDCSDNEGEFHETCYHSSSVLSISPDQFVHYSLVHWTQHFNLMFSSLHLRFVRSLKGVMTQMKV